MKPNFIYVPTARFRNTFLVLIAAFLVLYYILIFLTNSEDQPSPRDFHSSSTDIANGAQETVNYVSKLKIDEQNCSRNPEDQFLHHLKIMKRMGGEWTSIKVLEDILGACGGKDSILQRMRTDYRAIQQRASASERLAKHGPYFFKLPGQGKRREPVINVAGVSCGPRRKEFLVMVKSVIMFTQDASVHIILFSDKGSILDVAMDLLGLKWTVNKIGLDFTYELHLEWYPPVEEGVNWSKMYRPCATQRLFFPVNILNFSGEAHIKKSLLPHVDALIYLDTDILVVSNLTDLWSQFGNKMKDMKFVAMAANNEITAQGWYNKVSKIPYYGRRGLNAGVMLMNLTQMRAFDFQNRSIATQMLYREKIELADQDIVNIIFHTFSEKVNQLDCSYNFNWVHCGIPKRYDCHTDTNYCFCNATLTNGVQIVHGNTDSFRNPLYPFLNEIYRGFEQFDFLTDAPSRLISELKSNFTTLKNPCEPLTGEILYRNSESYFSRVNANTERGEWLHR